MVEQEIIVKQVRNDDDTLNMMIMGELVRCKDCRWRDNQKGATAWMPCRALITPDDFYCPSGERKDGDHHG